MYAKKHLGQHFLTSQKALFDMVTAGDIHPGDIVLEVGPGKGVLTERLLAAGAHVIAIEKDRELVPLLEERFIQEIKDKRLDIIDADILTFDPSVLKSEYKLIANIPYYITGAIIEQFLSTTHQPERMVLLIQKEVAERIIARDQRSGNLGGKQSVLSIAVSAYGTPKIVAKVPAGAFFPPPKVDSAIISIEGISRDFFSGLPAQAGIDEKKFFELLKFCFGKKRKQLAGSLSDFVRDKATASDILTVVSIDPKARPETLTLSDWKKLTQALQKIKNGVQ